MSESVGAKSGSHFARTKALAVLRVRGTALAVALLPTAVAVVLFVAGATGRTGGTGWDAARWILVTVAVLALLLAVAVSAVVVRARPAVSPTVPIAEEAAPDLYRLVRDLADRLDVPVPSAIALTPDCDSWLEDRTHPAARNGSARCDGGKDRHGRTRRGRGRRLPPVLVIGSPFLWWMRIAELRAVIAPVVAGTGPSAQPDIAAARRFVRGLDAAVAVAARRPALAFVGWTVRLLLACCRHHAAEMERGVAAEASARAQDVDYGLRIVAQEQVGLAYAGWDRLLTRVALPAWRMGRWPSHLDAGVVSALTELSSRDRLAEGFASRLGERPACDLLEEPGAVDEAASLLAARLFHGGPVPEGTRWSPVDWNAYAEEVVARKWRLEATRLHRVLDEFSPPLAAAEVMDVTGGRGASLGAVACGAGSTAGAAVDRPSGSAPTSGVGSAASATAARPGEGAAPRGEVTACGGPRPPGGLSVPALSSGHSTTPVSSSVPQAPATTGAPAGDPAAGAVPDEPLGSTPFGSSPAAGPTLARVVERLAAAGGGAPRLQDELAERLSREVAREEEAALRAARIRAAAGLRSRSGEVPGTYTADSPAVPWTDTVGGASGTTPLFPLQAPRTARELLADHITAMVCCAAVDTAGAVPGLDWLDGPVLLLGDRRGADLGSPVLSLLEDGDPGPLRAWLANAGVRSEEPVRLG